MAFPIQRIQKTEQDPERRAADRALLLSRIAVGLAHEGKNPLQNMVLHLQLTAEKLASATPVDKHLAALREGIGRVDHLLKAFGEFAAPDHLPADLGAALDRAVLLFAHEARRAGAELHVKAPTALHVESDSRVLGDLVAHALVAGIEFARDGGRLLVHLETRGPLAVLDVRAEDGAGSPEQARPHLDAARRLAAEAGCELSIDTPPAGGARLSLSFLHRGNTQP